MTVTALAVLLLAVSLAERPMNQRTRIVAIGDSTTAGTPGWESPLEAPPRGRGDETSQYAYWLMAAHPQWEILNHGVNGERSDQIRARFERDVIEAAPKVVVIIAGVNDVYQGRPVAHVIGQLHEMYQRAKAAGLHVVAGSILPYNTATPEQNARIRDINDWIREQPGVVFVDTRASVSPPGDADALFDSPDGLHPTAAGYRRMAEAIAPALETILR